MLKRIPIPLVIVVSLFVGACTGGGGANKPSVRVIGGATISGTAGQTLEFAVSLDNAGFSGVTLSWSVEGPQDIKGDPNNAITVDPAGASVTGKQTRTFKWIPRNDQAGDYTLTLTLEGPSIEKVQQVVTLKVASSTEGITLLGNRTFTRSVALEVIEIEFEFDAPSVASMTYSMSNEAEGMQIAAHPSKIHTARFTWEPTTEQKGTGNKQFAFKLQAADKDSNKQSPLYDIVIFLQKCESTSPTLAIVTDGQSWSSDGRTRTETANGDYTFTVTVTEKGTAVSKMEFCSYLSGQATIDVSCADMKKKAGTSNYDATFADPKLSIGESKSWNFFYQYTDACGTKGQYTFDIENNLYIDFVLSVTITKPAEYGSSCAELGVSCPGSCHPTLKICTETCTGSQSCGDGKNSSCEGSGTKYCIPKARLSCAPCDKDADCGPGGRCAKVGEQGGVDFKACQTACNETDNKCPNGFVCDESGHCKLESGQCQSVDRVELCKACSSHDECGDYTDKCIGLNVNNPAQKGTCGQSCLGLSGCPFGYTCVNQNDAFGSQCVPDNAQHDCNTVVVPQQPTAQTLVVTEFLANSNGKLAGTDPVIEGVDTNGDGKINETLYDDEFVELRNISTDPLDLTGVRFVDDEGDGFTFPPGTILQPGKVALIFGGGTPIAFGTDNLVFVATGTNKLQLANGSEVIKLTVGATVLWACRYTDSDAQAGVSMTLKESGLDPALSGACTTSCSKYACKPEDAGCVPCPESCNCRLNYEKHPNLGTPQAPKSFSPGADKTGTPY